MVIALCLILQNPTIPTLGTTDVEGIVWLHSFQIISLCRYAIPLIKKGFKTELYEDDLYGIIKRCDSKLCGDRSDVQWKKSNSMYRLLWNRFGYWYTFLFLIMLTWTEIYRYLFTQNIMPKRNNSYNVRISTQLVFC